MKNTLLLLLLCSTGCSTWLRYDYERALKNLPVDKQVVNINNDYIEYSTTNGVYKAYYTTDGTIYQTITNKN